MSMTDPPNTLQWMAPVGYSGPDVEYIHRDHIIDYLRERGVLRPWMANVSPLLHNLHPERLEDSDD